MGTKTANTQHFHNQRLAHYHQHHKNNRMKLSKDMLVSHNGFDIPATSGLAFGSPAPRNRVSYDSFNRPSTRYYNPSRLHTMSKKIKHENNHRLDIAKAVGRCARKPCGCGCK